MTQGLFETDMSRYFATCNRFTDRSLFQPDDFGRVSPAPVRILRQYGGFAHEHIIGIFYNKAAFDAGMPYRNLAGPGKTSGSVNRADRKVNRQTRYGFYDQPSLYGSSGPVGHRTSSVTTGEWMLPSFRKNTVVYRPGPGGQISGIRPEAFETEGRSHAAV
jgi:hypothetical protein